MNGYDEPKLKCKHPNRNFLGVRQEDPPNDYCINCGQRWYGGKEYTKEEWYNYVNNIS